MKFRNHDQRAEKRGKVENKKISSELSCVRCSKILMMLIRLFFLHAKDAWQKDRMISIFRTWFTHVGLGAEFKIDRQNMPLNAVRSESLSWVDQVDLPTAPLRFLSQHSLDVSTPLLLSVLGCCQLVDLLQVQMLADNDMIDIRVQSSRSAAFLQVTCFKLLHKSYHASCMTHLLWTRDCAVKTGF